MSALDLLREPRFRRLYTGQVVSLLGDGVVRVALAFAVLDLTGSASDLGIVLAARALPMVLFLLAGGVVADRVSRRSVMVGADLLRFATQGLMGVLLVTHGATIAWLAVLAALGGLGTGFFNPASTGLLPAMVPAESFQHANALRALAASAGEVVGPAIAGVLIVGVGAGWAVLLDAVTFAVSAACLISLALPDQERLPHASFFSDLRGGWSEFRSRRWLWTTVACAGFGNGIYAVYPVLGPYVARLHLGGAPAWAAISAAFGAGAVLGGVVVLRLRPRRPGLVCAFSWGTIVAPLTLLALEAPVVPIAAAGFVAGAGMVVGNTVWESTMQRHIPIAVLSRVTAYDWFGSLAMQPIGYAVWGPIAAGIGVGEALGIAAGLQVLTIVAMLAVREVRALTPEPLLVAQ